MDPLSPLRRLLPLLVALAILASTGCATTGETESDPADIPELQEDTERQGTVEEESDPEMDVRSWRLVPLRVTEDPFIPGVSPDGSELRLGAVGMITGANHPINPNQAAIQLIFMGVSDEEGHLGSVQAVEFLLDGEHPLDLRVLGYDDSPGQGYFIEVLNVPVAREELARLADASEVEGRVGPHDFTLASQELASLRSFLTELPDEIH